MNKFVIALRTKQNRYRKKNETKCFVVLLLKIKMIEIMKKNDCIKYDKQHQQGKAAFNERNPHMTQQQEPVARSPGGPQT
jgi:hypothetical protein